jgi:hypothetical protein
VVALPEGIGSADSDAGSVRPFVLPPARVAPSDSDVR